MKPFLKHFAIATALSAFLLIIFFSINAMSGGGTPQGKELVEFILISFSYSYPLYFVNGYTFYFVQRWVKEKDKNKWQFWFWGVPLSVVVSIVTIRIIQYAIYNFYFEYDFPFFEERFWDQIETPLWISTTIGITFFTYHFVRNFIQKKDESQKQIIAKVSTSRDALKSQIGPHFLFNNLNVLSGLVEENPDKAQDFIADLSQVYRYVLEQNKKDLIPIQEELNFAKTYMSLVQTRFEEGLHFELDNNLYNSDYQIVPLTLQLLLENSIKHNLVSKSQPLTIKIEQKNNRLIVENNYNPKRQLAAGTGLGLQNIQDKYRQFTTQKVDIQQTKNQFIVSIPLLTQKSIQMENYTDRDYIEAKERVKSIRGFYWNLAAYFVVNAYLVFLDMRHDNSLDWAYWPMLGWGMGVIFNAIHAFGWFNSMAWEERKINEILEKKQQERERFRK